MFHGIKIMLDYNLIGIIVLIQIILYYLFKKKLLRFIVKFNLIDKPGKNKIHKSTTPLTGGIILYFSIILYLLFFLILKSNNYVSNLVNDTVLVLFVGCSFAFFIGIIDDILHLKVEKKILALSIFNILLFQQIPFFQSNVLIFNNSFFDTKVSTISISLIISILFFLAYHYALVILDGINGIFGFYSILIFSIFFFVFNMNIVLENFIFYILLILIFITILNMKSELFFGNSGSLLISALIPYLILYFYNQRENEIYFFHFLSLVIVPILDMVRLFVKRLSLGKSPFLKDLNHFHHLLLNKYSVSFSIIIYLALCFIPFLTINFFKFNPVIIVLVQVMIFFYLTRKLRSKSI